MHVRPCIFTFDGLDHKVACPDISLKSKREKGKLNVSTQLKSDLFKLSPSNNLNLRNSDNDTFTCVYSIVRFVDVGKCN